MSTVLTQTWVEDEIRGRVFSIDMLILGGTAAISTTIAGFLVEFYNLSLKSGFISFSCLMMVCGLVFTYWRPDSEQSMKQ